MNTPIDPTLREPRLLTLLASMLHTRLSLAAIDIEAHARATLVALLAWFAALVLGLVAFAFAGVAVIAVFWETHRVAAAIGTTLGYLAITGLVAALARAAWMSRPPALAATLHELDLDREALRGNP